jgi:hypothetical protein
MHLQPNTYRRTRLGDDFDDLLSSIGNGFSSLDVPAMSNGGSIITPSPTIVATPDLSQLVTNIPGLDVSSSALTPMNPATSSSSWADIIGGVSKIAPAISNAYSTAQTSAAQRAIANAQIAALPTAASVSSAITSLTSSPYFSYIAIGGFALLALSVLGGSSSSGSRRRR